MTDLHQVSGQTILWNLDKNNSDVNLLENPSYEALACHFSINQSNFVHCPFNIKWKDSTNFMDNI